MLVLFVFVTPVVKLVLHIQYLKFTVSVGIFKYAQCLFINNNLLRLYSWFIFHKFVKLQYDIMGDPHLRKRDSAHFSVLKNFWSVGLF